MVRIALISIAAQKIARAYRKWVLDDSAKNLFGSVQRMIRPMRRDDLAHLNGRIRPTSLKCRGAMSADSTQSLWRDYINMPICIRN